MKKLKLMVIDDNMEFCSLVKEYARITTGIKEMLERCLLTSDPERYIKEKQEQQKLSL